MSCQTLQHPLLRLQVPLQRRPALCWRAPPAWGSCCCFFVELHSLTSDSGPVARTAASYLTGISGLQMQRLHSLNLMSFAQAPKSKVC